MAVFQYGQVRALINELAAQYNVFRLLTRFESSLTIVQSSKKTMSTMYQLLVSELPAQDRCELHWEKDGLGLELTSEQWKKIREW